jgi:hypothetical protein
MTFCPKKSNIHQNENPLAIDVLQGATNRVLMGAIGLVSPILHGVERGNVEFEMPLFTVAGKS